MQLPLTLLTPNLQSDVPEKWRAKALSQVDPSSIDKVWISLLSFSPNISNLGFFFSVTLYPDVTTATLISASLMIIQASSLSSFSLHMC
jgi:hypothetical protein